ncbi:movement protein [Furcraea necrotic streak virus]|uniref:Movement protein n=1 Tax=Furcraea necrotic streak virus TaxID=676234 RepID=D3U5B6_9TOMB|nr:movement protein [Furcraea necrotic streak virus]ACW84409.1 movement protein [Furcraea necrotic streak virus]
MVSHQISRKLLSSGMTTYKWISVTRSPVIRANVSKALFYMEYNIQSDGERVVRTRRPVKDRDNKLSGVKEQAVGQTSQKSHQGQGNGVMTNIAETQTITVTYNFNF